jgi:SAM-dependent methyltransferase
MHSLNGYVSKVKIFVRGFKKTRWELLLISFIALFLELVIIRWLSAEVRIFAYFKNLPLMAAFLGFGIGFFLYKNSDIIFPRFPILVCLLAFIIAFASRLDITHVIFVSDPKQYFLLGGWFGTRSTGSVLPFFQTAKGVFVIVSLFFLTMATFATLTSKIGELLNQEQPLVGYSINVVGSLLGIIGFSLVSHFEWPPAIWLILVFLPLLHFYRNHIKLAAIYFLAAVTLTFIAGYIEPAIWSPYYHISVLDAPFPYDPNFKGIQVNYDGFQTIKDLSQSNIDRMPEDMRRNYIRHYNIPYFLSRKKIGSVLILGGGAGNDAAAALRNGASRVDVVEIDPAIARIGYELHPEKPYSSEKVHLYIDDARSFLQKNNLKYDLIVFAGLDSHTVFSSLSSLRLDNFIFTKESLLSAKNILKPGGGIAIDFIFTKEWLFLRHFNGLKEVMGKEPLIYGSNVSATLLAGDIFDGNRNPGITSYEPLEAPASFSKVELTRDDWPFLFLEKRGIPFHYILPLFIIFVLSLIPLRMSQIKVQNINWHLFFMGSAFLLIETKAVTTLALIFGSTWIVNSIVLSSVLIMILLANLLTARLSFMTFTRLYIGLFAALLFNYFLNVDIFNEFAWNIRVLSGGLVIGLPLFFAALIFAKAFAAVESPSLSLASNLFGGLVGGLLEYLDMWTGLRWLNLIALILYGLSFVFLYAGRKRGQPDLLRG